jgi:hypothetical protein
MDHLPIPESCLPRARPVLYLGLAPAYDRKGFESFPSRHGIDPDQLISLPSDSITEAIDYGEAVSTHKAYVESFLQEWLWFGALHEFELVCGLEMDVATSIRPGIPDYERPYRLCESCCC